MKTDSADSVIAVLDLSRYKNGLSAERQAPLIGALQAFECYKFGAWQAGEMRIFCGCSGAKKNVAASNEFIADPVMP